MTIIDQNLEKMKKIPGDIIILHKCTKNYNQMMYSSWNMVCDRCNCCFSFWATFCPFTSLITQKIKILKKWTKIWRYHQLWLFFTLGHFFPFYPPNNLKNQNFEKMKTMPGDIIILHMCTKNYDQMMYASCLWFYQKSLTDPSKG